VLAQWLQSVMQQLLFSGGITIDGWKSVEEVADFPAKYGTFVVSNDGKMGFDEEGYNRQRCGMLQSYGMDTRFWWCN
jgi:hypothetical protein